MKEGLKNARGKGLDQLTYQTVCLCVMGQNLVTKPHPAAREAGTQSALLKTKSSSIWKKRRTDSGHLRESCKHLHSCPQYEFSLPQPDQF